MRKFKLDLDKLEIESWYATAEEGAARRGTVHGAAETYQPQTEDQPDSGVTCGNWPSEFISYGWVACGETWQCSGQYCVEMTGLETCA